MNECNGKVFKKVIGRHWVKSGDRTAVCTCSSKLRKRLLYPISDPSSIRRRVVAANEIETVDPVTMGDEAAWRDSGDGTGMITEVFTRRNKLNRRAAGYQPLEQVIVTNLDQIVAVVSASQPSP